MKNKSLFIKITILLSTLLVGIFTGQQAFADDGTIDIVIHKQLWDQAPDAAIQNTGAADQDIKDPIEGVGFTIYDITEDYYKDKEEYECIWRPGKEDFSGYTSGLNNQYLIILNAYPLENII